MDGRGSPHLSRGSTLPPAEPPVCFPDLWALRTPLAPHSTATSYFCLAHLQPCQTRTCQTRTASLQCCCCPAGRVFPKPLRAGKPMHGTHLTRTSRSSSPSLVLSLSRFGRAQRRFLKAESDVPRHSQLDTGDVQEALRQGHPCPGTQQASGNMAPISSSLEMWPLSTLIKKVPGRGRAGAAWAPGHVGALDVRTTGTRLRSTACPEQRPCTTDGTRRQRHALRQCAGLTQPEWSPAGTRTTQRELRDPQGSPEESQR